MDLGILLDATEEIEVPFAGEISHLTIYSLGGARLTAEQREPLAELLNTNGDGLKYTRVIEAARLTLPLLIKDWDVTWRGEPLPVDRINELDEAGNRKYPIPDDFLVAVNNKIQEATERPSNGSEPPLNGSQPEERLESLPAASITT